jgi:hypothetical protein
MSRGAGTRFVCFRRCNEPTQGTATLFRRDHGSTGRNRSESGGSLEQGLS